MRIWIAASLLAYASISPAQNWQSLGKSSAIGGEVFIDASSLTTSRNWVTGSILVDLDVPQPLKLSPMTRFRSAIIQHIADCTDNSVSVKHEIDYADLHAKGAAVYARPNDPPTPMIPISGYPLGEIFYRYACSPRTQADAPASTPAVSTAPLGMRASWSGAAPNISEEEWAAYEKSQAAICGTNLERCRDERDNFLFSHWPAPRAKIEELQEPCRTNDGIWADDSVRQYANSGDIQQRGGALFEHWLGSWAAQHFPNRAYDQRGSMESWCSDGRFQVMQWQRSTGYRETGKIGKSDVNDFVTRWAPVVLRMKADATPRNKAQAAFEGQRQVEINKEAIYANGPTIFDVRLGSRVRELTDCGNHIPGRDFNPMYIKVPTTCYERYDTTLRFPPPVQPSWVDGPIKLSLDGEFISGMRFTATDPERMVQTIDSRFGIHRGSEVPMHVDGTVLCDQFNNCRPGRPARDWIKVSYKWDTETVSVSASHEKGQMETEVSIRYNAVDQARKMSAEREEALSREEREKKESQQKKF